MFLSCYFTIHLALLNYHTNRLVLRAANSVPPRGSFASRRERWQVHAAQGLTAGDSQPAWNPGATPPWDCHNGSLVGCAVHTILGEGTPEAVVQGKFTALGLQHGHSKQRPRRTPVFPAFPVRPARNESLKDTYSIPRLPRVCAARLMLVAPMRKTLAARRRIPDQSALHVFHRERPAVC